MDYNSIVVVGCGGTGSYLIQPLARFLNSVNYQGHIYLCDGDAYDVGNRDRQNFDDKAIGISKSEYHASVIADMFPALNVNMVTEYLGRDDLKEFGDKAIFINCADNHAIRKFVEDYVDQSSDSMHICCGNERTRGQVQISGKSGGSRVFESIFKRYPEFNSVDADRSTMTCEEFAKLPSGGQVVSANMMAASIALNYALALLTKTDHGFIVPHVSFNTASNAVTSGDNND